MTDTWITLGLYVVGLIGGGYLGHQLTKQHYLKRMEEMVSENFKHDGFRLQQIAHFRNQLAKFHTMRDKTGRFIKRQ